MGSVPSLRGDGGRIWIEEEVQIGKVFKFQVGAGKAGRGILHFWTVDPSNALGHRLGQYKAVDVEDIIAVNHRPTLKNR